MKNNILNDLKEYREFLTEKFGFNNINVPNDNHHVSLDGVGNGINLYVRTRLGNFIKIGKEECRYQDCYYDYMNNYIGNFDDDNHIFVLKEENSGMIYSNVYDVHFFKADTSGMLYAKISENKNYLLVEKLKFGTKVDVVEITTKFYDECVFNYADEYEKVYDLVDKISSGKTSVVPEFELVTRIYEDEIEVEFDKNIGSRTYRYLKDEYVVINGMISGINGFRCKKSFIFYEVEDVELMVNNHFEYIDENLELISECLGKEVKKGVKSFVKTR